jgi:hypothetical protein
MLSRWVGACVLVCMVAGALVGTSHEGTGFVSGVDAERLTERTLGTQFRAAFQAVHRQGVQYAIMGDGEPVGHLVIGVFADDTAALEAFNDHMTYSAVGPDRDLSGKIGAKGAGWPTRVVFVRDNAAVSLWLGNGELDRVALAIDRALSRGTDGVRRDARVPTPRIVRVDCPAQLLAGHDAELKAVVALPEGPAGDHLCFTDRQGIASGYLVPIPVGRQLEVSRSFQYRAPTGREHTGEQTFWVCYATTECVVTSRKVTVTVVPGEQGPPAS